MTTCLLTRAVLRVWGIIVLLNAIASAPPFVIQILTSPAGTINSYGNLFVIVHLLSRLFLGVALLVYAEQIARWLFPTEERLRFSLDADHLQRVLFATVGIYFVVLGFSVMVVDTYLLISSPDWVTDPAMNYFWERRRETLIPAWIQFLAGTGLLLGRNGLSRLWRSLRPMRKGPEDEGA